METTERIVEAYCRYVMNMFTISNIKCRGQYEIDLLAIDTTHGIKRYHIECGVSISEGYSKLTANDFSRERLKKRAEQAGQRRTIDYFIHRKFGLKEVLSTLKNYGFKKGKYNKIIVTWDSTKEAKIKAKRYKIIIWDFRDILKNIAQRFRDQKTYFTDDTLRTIQLFAKATMKEGK